MLSRHFRSGAGRAGLLALPLLFAPLPGHAQTIIGNLPGEGSEQVTNENFNSRGAVSFRMTSDAYNLSAVILRLSFFNGIGTETNNNPNPIVELRSDNGSLPGSVLTTFNNPTFSGGNVATDYTFQPGSAVTLEANTKYWLHLYGADGSGEYFWYRSGPEKTPTSPTGAATFTGYLRSQDSGANWFDDGRKNTFEIQGTLRSTALVPEPASALLFLPAAALLLRRRREQHS